MSDLPWHDSHTLPKIVAPAPSDARSANARGSVVDEAGCCCARTASECETIATATANDITTTIAAVFMVSSTSEEGTHYLEKPVHDSVLGAAPFDACGH